MTRRLAMRWSECLSANDGDGLRRAGWFLRGAFVLAALMGLWGCDKAAEASKSPQQLAKDLVLERLDGGHDPLAAYRGKVVVLNVWATWCGPCRLELVSLQKLADRLDPQHFVVLGVAIDENPLLVREFLRRKGIDFAAHIDAGHKHFSLAAVPATYVLGPDGGVRRTVLGEQRWDGGDVVEWLVSLREGGSDGS